MKKYLIQIFCVILSCFTLAGCKNSDEDKHVISTTKLTEKTGFKIDNDVMSYIFYTDGNSHYYKFTSKIDNRKIEYLIKQAKIIIIDESNGIIKYAERSYTQTLVNPLHMLLNRLEQIDFELTNKLDTYEVYTGKETQTFPVQKQIDYVENILMLKWLDGKDYVFSYFEYSDGEILITADAPIEINPAITHNTKWVIDMDNLVLKNTKTNQQIDLQLVGINTGKALSPNPQNPETQTYETTIQIYKNIHDNSIEKIELVGKENMFHGSIIMLNDFQIPFLEFQPNMRDMSDNELDIDLMLLSQIQYLLQ